MRIFRHLAQVPGSLKGAVIAIGNFDGVHRGHQKLIRTAALLAEERRAPLAVMVFEPTPQEFFNPGGTPFRLTPFRSKARLIAELGADALYAFPFDAELAHQPAEDFVLDTLIDKLGAGAVAVGEDFQFGAGRAGSAAMLAYMGEMEGLAAEIVPPVMAGPDFAGEKISSTIIRQLLAAGEPEAAAGLMGRPFAVEGRIAHGAARGRTMGFPTANLSLDGYLRPAFGIYAVRATVFEDEKPVLCRDGVANLGIRPMFLMNEPLLETFLFDFDGDIYGKHMAVKLLSYLRPDAKFTDVDALIMQMNRDKEHARALLARV
jgi:riboflavin kinase/FMN adenylyltransferase